MHYDHQSFSTHRYKHASSMQEYLRKYLRIFKACSPHEALSTHVPTLARSCSFAWNDSSQPRDRLFDKRNERIPRPGRARGSRRRT